MADLESLLTLPVGMPVSLEMLDPPARRAVRALPVGAVERDENSVIRRAVRSLQVDLAVVRAPGWRTGLEQAARFSPFCRRTVLLDRRPPRPEQVLAEVGFYGVGAVVPVDDNVELVLEPERYRPLRHTAAAGGSWRICTSGCSQSRPSERGTTVAAGAAWATS
ncbi:hypothetical protein GCM10010358_25730 [Streptomyces minutiscleroticus]|uniref:Uncharacterized protein n=1 Tax=Streptomyces minutiscleroticus TaxID=68238 RepID=A0A918KN74_9ACTN|nr:hypothetical protein [Streptomyces minutiscleroticus]GGX70068.1 hypothetical protein GCM10010358_25730 [Streptomyces minutiscleroticus]